MISIKKIRKNYAKKLNWYSKNFIHFTAIIALNFSLWINQVYAMTPLSEEEMSNNQGQALFNLTNIAANENGNPNADVGFYRFGMEAKVELNANIKRLQLDRELIINPLDSGQRAISNCYGNKILLIFKNSKKQPTIAQNFNKAILTGPIISVALS